MYNSTSSSATGHNNLQGRNLAHIACENRISPNADAVKRDSEMAKNIVAASSFLDLPWTDPIPSEHLPLFPDQTLDLHELIAKKVAGDPAFTSRWTKLDQDKNYAAHSRIVINAGYPQRKSLAYCGKWLRRDSRSSRWAWDCDDLRLCHSCCLSRARALSDEFGACFDLHGEVWNVTVSLSHQRSHWHRVYVFDPFADTADNFPVAEDEEISHVPFNPLLNHLLMRRQIAAIQSFGRSRRHITNGIVGRVEMSWRFDGVFKTLPHGHFIFFADRVLKEDFYDLLERLSLKIRAFPTLHAWTREHGVNPSIHAKRIPNEAGPRRALAYLYKAIELVDPYWHALGHLQGGSLVPLNQNLRSLLYDVPLVFKNLNRVVRLGGCHGSSSSYFGNRAASKANPAPSHRKTGPTKSSRDNEVNDESVDDPTTDEAGMINQFMAWAMDYEERPHSCRYEQALSYLGHPNQ